MSHEAGESAHTVGISQLVEELQKRTRISYVLVRERMSEYLKLQDYDINTFNRLFRNKEPSQNTYYELKILLAYLHAVIDDVPADKRCTAEEAFRLFSMARISIDNFRVLKTLFPEAEYRAAWKPYQHLEAPTDKRENVSTFLQPPYSNIVIGREDDISRLWERLGSGPDFQQQPLTVIRGWPGVGKTTLVNRLVHDENKVLAPLYPDGILWTSLGPSGDVLQALKKWARQLGAVHVEAMHSLEDVTQNMRFALQGKRVLLVIDDVWDEKQANPFMNLQSGQTTFLFTTRFTRLALDIGVTLANVYVLEGLSIDQSLVLMQVIAPNASQAYANQLRPLIETLEGLPLALRVAGKLIEEQFFLGIDPTSLFDELQTNFRAFKDKAPSDRFDETTGQTPTIGMLFRLSLQNLPRSEQEAFACMGSFAPKPAAFNLRAIAAVCGLEDPVATVKTLVGRGLLEPQGSERFQMHYTLAMYGRHLLDTGLAELNDG